MRNTAQDDDWEEQVLKAGELLLNGWGYNWYRAENLLRADDVLLRNHAEALLGEAAAALRRAEAAFRQTYLPPPSREHPTPDPKHLAGLRATQSLLAELDELRTRLRGAAMPPGDKFWHQQRDEADLLTRLGRCDAQLAAAAEALRTQTISTTAESLPGAVAELRPHLDRLAELLTQRRALLSMTPI